MIYEEGFSVVYEHDIQQHVTQSRYIPAPRTPPDNAHARIPTTHVCPRPARGPAPGARRRPAANEPASRTSPWRLTSRAPPRIRAPPVRPPSTITHRTNATRAATTSMLSPTESGHRRTSRAKLPTSQLHLRRGTREPTLASLLLRRPGAEPASATQGTAPAPRPRPRLRRPHQPRPGVGRLLGRGEVSISRPARSRRKTCGSSLAGRGAKRAGRGAATWRARPRRRNPSAPPRSAASRRARARARR